ncbi:MAG: Vms1/Ankzf1 family peptidyl-tRNA hydrolase [Gaiellaceae bacterium]
MAATVSWERLRELAAFRVEKGCAISLYVDLDPSETPTAGDAETRVNSLLAEGERSRGANRGELTHDQKQGLKADFDRIRTYVDQEFDRDGARGLAVFSAGLDNVWRTLSLNEAVADEIRVAQDFYLTPLVPLLGRGDGALVAVVGRERGVVYQLRGGRLEEVADHSEEQPGQHDQGGWSQSRFKRHIDNLASEHMRTVADELSRQARRLRDAGVVVVCAEEMRGEFGELLAHEVQKMLAGWTTAEAHASPADLLEIVTPLLDEWRAGREAATLERWREEAGRNGRASSGWEATLEAASDGRVEILLFREGTDRGAWRCPTCGRASVKGGSCPLDGTRMEEHDAGLDLAVHQTLAHGGSVCAVRYHQDLEPVEGIGALLRY